MASFGGEHQISGNSQTAEAIKNNDSREGSVDRKACKDRDEKLKLARDRQNEERQRKIEELKAQAEAAQRYREQKEEERRRRIDEIRNRDIEKRQQVEERKKAIMEAEKERREYILRKNQERESRLESKKKERNSIGFAFGSSTPRLLEPVDFVLVSPSTFWGNRRSTSISNVAGASLSRRSSERELVDCASKKRATSAGGTNRHDEDKIDSSQMMFRSVARRKTDLMPTIPSPRDGHYGSRSSLSNTPRTPGSRSGNVTPGGSINTSRPGSAMSTSTNLSTSGHVPRRLVASARKPRPASIAGTGVSLEDIKLKKDKTPVKPSSPLSAQITPKRTSNMMSTSLIVSSRLSSAEKKTPYKKEPFTPKSGSKPLSKTGSFDRLNKSNKENKPKDSVTPMNKSTTLISLTPLESTDVPDQEPSASTKSKDEKNALNTVKIDESNSTSVGLVLDKVSVPAVDEKIDQGNEKNLDGELKKEILISKDNTGIQDLDQSDIMSASLISKSKIITEEEAKAALAERRRLAREEAERQAELERQRLESEHLAEIRRQEEEVERQRQFEEEAVRLAAEQRKTEEERLRLAIEETQQREKEERLRREEEEKQRIEREEAEKRAREEAEKQRLEVVERLKREEKEREERRKRVEAIMSRTRKVRNTTNQTSTPLKEDNENVNKAVSDEQIQQTLNSDLAQKKISICESSLENSSTEVPVPTAAILTTSEKNTSQAMYEQSVVDKEVSLMKNFSTVNEKAKNVQEQQLQTIPQNIEIFNGKHNLLNSAVDGILPPNKRATDPTLQNGNGHIENINKQNEMHTLENTESPAASKLIDHSKQTLDLNTLNFNNNSLLSTPNALVTANNHEHRDIPLL